MNQKTQLTIAASIISVALIFSAFVIRGGEGFSFSLADRASYKEFDVVMKNNRYNPSTITANLGDTVVINFTNKDNVDHALEIPEFNATLPGGHVLAGSTAKMEFVANKRINTDAAVCGGPIATDKTDDHGEELIVNII